MLILGLARAGLPVHVMISYVTPQLRTVEGAPGLRFTDFTTGAKHYLDALARNELVLLYTDMDFFPGGRTADFFGAPCHPPHGAARLAQAAGAPILPVYAVKEGARHRLCCDEAISPEGASQEALENAILRSQERFIGRYPSHWLIFHDPWDLEERVRTARSQLRSLISISSVAEWWGQLTKGSTPAKDKPWQ